MEVLHGLFSYQNIKRRKFIGMYQKNQNSISGTEIYIYQKQNLLPSSLSNVF